MLPGTYGRKAILFPEELFMLVHHCIMAIHRAGARMINVTIAGATYPLEQVSEGWVSQMVVEARKSGRPICVHVQVREPGAQVDLITAGCGGGGGGGRPPNDLERRIFAEWEKRKLQSGEFPPGQLQAFLKELARLL